MPGGIKRSVSRPCFSKPAPYAVAKRIKEKQNARWTEHELRIVAQSVSSGLDLDQTCALLPHRSFHSVKDQYYRHRDRTHDEPTALVEARRQKDAREGSAKLLQALINAGFVFIPRKAG